MNIVRNWYEIEIKTVSKSVCGDTADAHTARITHR